MGIKLSTGFLCCVCIQSDTLKQKMSQIEKVLMHLRSAMGDATYATHKRKGTHAGDEKDKKRSRTEKREPMDENTREQLTMELYQAVQKGDQPEVQRLLGCGMDINSVLGKYGKTVLSLSVKHLELLKFLLNAKANVNLKDEYGQTALWNACIMGKHDAAELLIKADADVDLAAQQVAPILTSVRNQTPAILKLLIANRASMDQPNDIGETALTLAARTKKVDFMKVLVDAGADVSHQTKNGDTAFTLVGDAVGYDRWNLSPDVRKMIYVLTQDIGSDALDRFEEVVEEQRNDKRYIYNKKGEKWRASRAALKNLPEIPPHIRENPSRDACSMDYFGVQTCEGNCWTYAALGMVVKFLQNDSVLCQAHPRLVRYQERLAATHPLLNAELISRNPTKNLDHNVWYIYKIMQLALFDEESKEIREMIGPISYTNTTSNGGSAANLLVSLLLHAGYRVTLKGFTHLGSMKMQTDAKRSTVDRKLKFRKGKVVQGEASTALKFLQYTSEYLIIRSEVKIKKDCTTENTAGFVSERIFTDYHRYASGFSLARLVQKQINDIDTAGILHRLCGAILRYKLDPEGDQSADVDFHAILLGFCYGKVIVCNSNDGKCKGDKGSGIDSVLKKGDQTVQLYYVFSPGHVHFPGKFSVGDDLIFDW